MLIHMRCSMIAVIGASVLGAMSADAQLMSTCAEKPPVRHGEFGCSTQTKVLPEGLREPVFWHIDRFDTEVAARAAVGDASVAFEDGGTWWLMSIEAETSNHRGGRHVAQVGPLPLPPARRYSMLIQSAVFGPGMLSLIIIPASRRCMCSKVKPATRRPPAPRNSRRVRPSSCLRAR